MSRTSVCKEMGSADIPLNPRTDSGESERRYAKNRWLVASAALLCQYSSIEVGISHEP